MCSIVESENTDFSINELHSSLIVHELKFRQRYGEEKVLNVTSEESNTREDKGMRGLRGRGRGRGRQNKSTTECYKCHKRGHYKNEGPD